MAIAILASSVGLAACSSTPSAPHPNATAHAPARQARPTTTLPAVVTTPTSPADSASFACDGFLSTFFRDFPSLHSNQQRAVSEFQGWAGEASTAAQADPRYATLAADMNAAVTYVASSKWADRHARRRSIHKHRNGLHPARVIRIMVPRRDARPARRSTVPPGTSTRGYTEGLKSLRDNCA